MRLNFSLIFLYFKLNNVIILKYWGDILFKLYKKYLKNYKKHIILGPMFKLVEAIFELLVPFVIARIIDNGLKNELLTDQEKIRFILLNGGLLLIFAVVGLCSTLVCQFFASRASQGFGTALRDDLFEHINTLSFKELDELSASSLLTRMNQDINNIQVSVAMLIRLVVRAPFLVIGATILSFIISYKAGIIFIVAGILLFVCIFAIMKYTVPMNKRAQAKLDTITTITRENLTGNRVVRAFSRQNDEFKRFVDNNIELKDIQIKLGRINALLNPLTFVIVNAAIITVLYFSGSEFSIGNLQTGDVTALYNYLLQIQIAVMVVANLIVIFTKASASASRINETFSVKSSIIYGNEKTIVDEATPFEFKNVSFRYNDNAKMAINNVSFKINKNETIGIIGGTGSGKSTLVNLMNRFYDLTEGEIYFYGRNIKDYENDFVNNRISMVLQKPVLFSGTIRDNLLWGNKDATDEDINNALVNSQSYEFVSKMENKENTMLYQGGKNLSGGQKQRLSIARAMIKDADILILDDYSSALDFKTEANLRKCVASLNKTTIIISQRASSIMHADKILVLDQGALVGYGAHNELLKNCPVYQEICESQDLKEAK